MARDDENQVLNTIRSPEDADGYKVSVRYVFNPEKKKFYPDSGDLYTSEPEIHRPSVTSVDPIDDNLLPPSSGIDCEGFKRCRFDVDVHGTYIETLKVRLLRWNEKANTWFPNGSSVDLMDAEGFSNVGGKVCLIEDEAFGATLFLKVSDFVSVSGFSGTFDMAVYYALC